MIFMLFLKNDNKIAGIISSIIDKCLPGAKPKGKCFTFLCLIPTIIR